MSITTRGWGGGPITTSGWGGMGGVIIRYGLKQFTLFVKRLLGFDVEIKRVVTFTLYIGREAVIGTGSASTNILNIKRQLSLTEDINRQDDYVLFIDPEEYDGYEMQHPYSEHHNGFRIFYILLLIAHYITQLILHGSLIRALATSFGSAKNFARRLSESMRNHILPDDLPLPGQIRFLPP